jgi:hypothetical protein
MSEEVLNNCAIYWNCNIDKVRNSFNEAIILGYPIIEPYYVPFLLAKEIKDEQMFISGALRNRFYCILAPIQFIHDQGAQNTWSKCNARLSQILQYGDSTSNLLPEYVQTYEQFLELVPAWKVTSDKVFVFHREKEIKLKQRSQKSGLSYIHAALVLQYYMVAQNREDAGMIDMIRMIRTCWSGVKLDKYIFNDVGDLSHQILKTLLQPETAPLTPHGISQENESAFMTAMQTYGPALVSVFAVHDDFCGDQASYDGMPSGALLGYHSMIIIGYRRDDRNNLWFLVQNWWHHKQFIEISQDYMLNCECVVYFVRTPQIDIPSVFPIHNHHFAENTNVDKPENIMFNMPPVYPQMFHKYKSF